MNRTVSALFSIVTLALLLWLGLSQIQTILAWICLAVLALIYQLVIWMPPGWWTRTKYGLAVLAIIALVFALHSISPNRAGMLISLLPVPLILLLGREQQRYRWFATILVIILLIVMVVLAPTMAFIWAAVPIVFSLYMSIRAINIYKEAYQMSQQHVTALSAANQELQLTYAALQEETAGSMRYAALSERTRLARDIHDGLGHQLTSLIVQLQALELMLPGDPEQAAQALPEMLAVARKAMAELRQAVETWREEESEVGLSALQGLASQVAAVTSLHIHFLHDEDRSSWSETTSVALYRILQEALTNIQRHASASAVSIEVRESDQQVSLLISDDGRFTESQPLKPGYGMKGMQERVESLGGELHVSQTQPHGLTLQVLVPIHPAAATDQTEVIR